MALHTIPMELIPDTIAPPRVLGLLKDSVVVLGDIDGETPAIDEMFYGDEEGDGE